jgi:hypothetical protein
MYYIAELVITSTVIMVVMWKIILTLQRKMWQIIKYFSMHGPLLLGKLNSPIGSRAGYISSE